MSDLFVISYLIFVHIVLCILMVYVVKLRKHIKCLVVRQINALPANVQPCSDEDVWRQKVVDFITQHLHQSQLQTKDVANAHYMSKRSFQRRFKHTFGVTFGAYLTEVRMALACERLLQNHRVSEVAAMCGYSNLSYFSYSFKQYYGVSPSNFLHQSNRYKLPTKG